MFNVTHANQDTTRGETITNARLGPCPIPPRLTRRLRSAAVEAESVPAVVAFRVRHELDADAAWTRPVLGLVLFAEGGGTLRAREEEPPGQTGGPSTRRALVVGTHEGAFADPALSDALEAVLCETPLVERRRAAVAADEVAAVEADVADAIVDEVQSLPYARHGRGREGGGRRLFILLSALSLVAVAVRPTLHDVVV